MHMFTLQIQISVHKCCRENERKDKGEGTALHSWLKAALILNGLFMLPFHHCNVYISEVSNCVV